MYQEEKQRFLEDGYCIIRNAISRDEVSILRAGFEELIQASAVVDENDSDWYFVPGPVTGKRILSYVHYVLDKSVVMRGLLGHPAILAFANSVLGSRFVTTMEYVTIKMPNEGWHVGWHRDLRIDEFVPSDAQLFLASVYMDQADETNCLWLIPGSHKWTNEAAISRETTNDFTCAGMEPMLLGPGDILFTNVLLLHCSPQVRGNTLRRTIYFMFYPTELILERGPYRRDYIAAKQRMIRECIRARQLARYSIGECPFEYCADHEESIDDEISFRHSVKDWYTEQARSYRSPYIRYQDERR